MKIFVKNKNGSEVEFSPNLIENLKVGEYTKAPTVGCFDEAEIGAYKRALSGLVLVSLGVVAKMMAMTLLDGPTLVQEDAPVSVCAVSFFSENEIVSELRYPDNHAGIPVSESIRPFSSISQWPEIERDIVLAWSPERWAQFFSWKISTDTFALSWKELMKMKDSNRRIEVCKSIFPTK